MAANSKLVTVYEEMVREALKAGRTQAEAHAYGLAAGYGHGRAAGVRSALASARNEAALPSEVCVGR